MYRMVTRYQTCMLLEVGMATTILMLAVTPLGVRIMRRLYFLRGWPAR